LFDARPPLSTITGHRAHPMIRNLGPV